MTTPDRYRAVWSEDETIPYPKDHWLDNGFPAASLPEGDELPFEVEVVYTAFVTGAVELYDMISLTAEGTNLDLQVLVVGAVQDNKNLLYVLDPKTGEILQFDLVEQDFQGVNSNLRTFVEFLYHFAVFVNADQGKPGRAARAAELRQTLQRIDPNAFDEDAWWPLVFEQLMS